MPGMAGAPGNLGPIKEFEKANPPKHFLATAYCCNFGQKSINGEGVTKDGTDLRNCKQVYGIAAGPGSGLSMGDVVRISPSPFGGETNFRVFDTGGAIVGKHIDIYIADCAAARKWGSKSVTVTKVPSSVGTGPQGEGPLLSDVTGIVTNPISSVANAIGDITSVLEKIVSSLFSSATWFRVGKVVIGVILGIYGFIIITRPATNALPPSIKTAAKVAAL